MFGTKFACIEFQKVLSYYFTSNYNGNQIRQNLYSDFYKDEPFVRVLPSGLTAATNRVRQSNFCDISVHVDINGSTLIIVTAIDNMVKGAAGQAIQNMNILFGFDETTGLENIPMLF